MQTLFKSQAEIIRDNSAAVAALASAHKADGTVFTYREILRAVGLPETRSMERALSQYLINNGGRRIPYHQRGAGVVDLTADLEPAMYPELAEGELDRDVVPNAEPVVDMEKVRAIHRGMYDALTLLSNNYEIVRSNMLALYAEWQKMAEAAGITPDTAQGAGQS